VKIELDSERLKANSLLIATPMYGGKAHGPYIESILALMQECQRYKVRAQFRFDYAESLITRARNHAAAAMLLNPRHTHLLFLDSDISFTAEDIMVMLALDKDVIAAPYPKKHIDWRKVREAAAKPSVNLAQITGEFVVNHLTPQFELYDPLRVRHAGTGMMLIRRTVLERMRDKLDIAYLLTDDEKVKWATDHMWDFFAVGRDPDSHFYLSEDYEFCRRCTSLGIDIWLCPWMKTRHVGQYFYEGNIEAVVKAGLEL
jgi:hypothetical protein